MDSLQTLPAGLAVIHKPCLYVVLGYLFWQQRRRRPLDALSMIATQAQGRALLFSIFSDASNALSPIISAPSETASIESISGPITVSFGVNPLPKNIFQQCNR